MSFLDLIRPFKAPMTGYVSDFEGWVQSLPRHELFAGGVGIGYDWQQHAPPFRPQESTMMCTAFAACSAASMMEHRETGKSIIFSPLELFARSGGTSVGNSIQNTVTAMQNGLCEEKDCPWIGPVSDWDPFVIRLMSAYAAAKISAGTLNASFSLKGTTLVSPDPNGIRLALNDSPVLLILNVGRGYFDEPAPSVQNGSAHAVVCADIEDDGRIKVFDSLMNGSGFSGFHHLSVGFPILYAFGLLDLPDGWQDQQKAMNRSMFPNALGRYGRALNPRSESAAALALIDAKKKNPTHAAYLDALWQLYVCAVAYGGYSVQDVMNYITTIRRGWPRPFDIDQPLK